MNLGRFLRSSWDVVFGSLGRVVLFPIKHQDFSQNQN